MPEDSQQGLARATTIVRLALHQLEARSPFDPLITGVVDMKALQAQAARVVHYALNLRQYVDTRPLVSDESLEQLLSAIEEAAANAKDASAAQEARKAAIKFWLTNRR